MDTMDTPTRRDVRNRPCMVDEGAAVDGLDAAGSAGVDHTLDAVDADGLIGEHGPCLAITTAP